MRSHTPWLGCMAGKHGQACRRRSPSTRYRRCTLDRNPLVKEGSSGRRISWSVSEVIRLPLPQAALLVPHNQLVDLAADRPSRGQRMATWGKSHVLGDERSSLSVVGLEYKQTGRIFKTALEERMAGDETKCMLG